MKQKAKVAKLNAGVLKNWGAVHRKLSNVEIKKGKIISGTTGMTIDKQSRFGFPSSFLAFNIIYWTTVFIAVYGMGDHDHDVGTIQINQD